MKISTLLMKPSLRHLEDEFRKLSSEVRMTSDETAEIRSFIDREIAELQNLSQSVSRLEEQGETAVPHDLYDHFRRLKLDLRFTRRKWLRMISNEARSRKIQERRSHVSTFAA